jgi:hypothetical protein
MWAPHPFHTPAEKVEVTNANPSLPLIFFSVIPEGNLLLLLPVVPEGAGAFMPLKTTQQKKGLQAPNFAHF